MFLGQLTMRMGYWMNHGISPFNGHASLTNGLVSYWKLTEKSGVRADSIVLTGNDLSDFNTVTYDTEGPSGTVAQFTSANTERLTKTSPGFDWTGPTTVAFWVRYENTSANYDTFNITSNPIRIYRATGTGSIAIDYRSFNESVSPGILADGIWGFIVTSHDGAGNYTSSLNDGTVTTKAGIQNSAGTNLFMGIYVDSASNPLQGRMSRFGVWNRKISAAEITSLYNSGAGKAYADLATSERSGLVSFWDLSEISGTRADSVGSNTLTDNNTVTSFNTGPSGAVATFGGNAANEFLSSSYSPGASASYTTAGWIRMTTAGVAKANEMVTGGSGDYIMRMNGTTAQVITSAFGVTNQLLIPEAAAGDWVFVAGYYENGVGSGLSVNGRAWQTAADVATGTWAATYVGARDATPTDTTEVDGEMANVAIYTGVADISVIRSLFNAGVGKRYASLTAADKVNLVSYYNLTEQSGSRADSFGANTLTDNNTVLAVVNGPKPPRGTASFFTAANGENLRRADNSSLRVGANDFTFAGWVRFRTLPVGTSMAIFSKGPQIDYSLDALDAGGGSKIFRGYTRNGGGYVIVSSSLLLRTDVWYHFVFWRDSSDIKNHLSINGVEAASAATAIVSDDSAGSLLLGSFTGSATNTLDGTLDEVGFWSRKLTAQERADLYALGSGLYY